MIGACRTFDGFDPIGDLARAFAHAAEGPTGPFRQYELPAELPDVLGPPRRLTLSRGPAFEIVAIVCEGVLEFDPGPCVGRHGAFKLLADVNARPIASGVNTYMPPCTLQQRAWSGIVPYD